MKEISEKDFNKIKNNVYNIDRKIDNAIEIQQYFNVSNLLNEAYDLLLEIEKIIDKIEDKK